MDFSRQAAFENGILTENRGNLNANIAWLLYFFYMVKSSHAPLYISKMQGFVITY